MSLPQEAFLDSLSTTPPLGSRCILTSAGLPLGCGSWLLLRPVLPPALLLAGAWGPGGRGRALGGHLQCARPSTRWRHSTSKATEGAWGPPEGEGQDGAAELCPQAAVPPGTRADPLWTCPPAIRDRLDCIQRAPGVLKDGGAREGWSRSWQQKSHLGVVRPAGRLDKPHPVTSLWSLDKPRRGRDPMRMGCPGPGRRGQELTLARPLVCQQLVAFPAATLEAAHGVAAEMVAASVVDQAFVDVCGSQAGGAS